MKIYFIKNRDNKKPDKGINVRVKFEFSKVGGDVAIEQGYIEYLLNEKEKVKIKEEHANEENTDFEHDE